MTLSKKNARHNIHYHRVEMAFLTLQNEIKSSVSSVSSEIKVKWNENIGSSREYM